MIRGGLMMVEVLMLLWPFALIALIVYNSERTC
jgi:hypothetical protein